ncbi:MAG: RimK family alpha-L-glutamate ligase [Actinomycetota bacterium]
MRLALLSRQPSSYSTQRLLQVGIAEGHDVEIIDTLRLAIDLSADEPSLLYGGHPVVGVDAVLPRIGASITWYGMAVVRQFEQMDVYTPITANGIANSRDKLRAFQILSRHAIGMPATTFVRDRADVGPAIERVGGAPVIIKLLEGTQGIGVILAPDSGVAKTVIETLQSTRQNVLIQRYVAESRGRDLRALVVGDEVVAAMRRISSDDDFRSNVHRGGRTEAVQLDEESRQLAIRAANIMGLRVAGVDLLESDDGPLVMEVNSSPGLEGIEQATGLDIAGAIIEYTARQTSFPELDIRQRLAVSTGFGVVELVVGECADLIGMSIGEGLRSRDISVLTLHQGSRVIPNPRDDRLLEADDRLLCFGEMEVMRSLVPEQRRRRGRPIVRQLDDLSVIPGQSNDGRAETDSQDPVRTPTSVPLDGAFVADGGARPSIIAG